MRSLRRFDGGVNFGFQLGDVHRVFADLAGDDHGRGGVDANFLVGLLGLGLDVVHQIAVLDALIDIGRSEAGHAGDHAKRLHRIVRAAPLCLRIKEDIDHGFVAFRAGAAGNMAAASAGVLVGKSRNTNLTLPVSM